MRAADFEKHEFEDGDVIFSEGDVASHAYIIRKGQVDIFVKNDGVETLLETIKPGEFVGEMALIDQEPRSATAIARGEVSCTFFSKAEFDASLAEADLLMSALVQLLTKRLRKSNALYEQARNS